MFIYILYTTFNIHLSVDKVRCMVEISLIISCADFSGNICFAMLPNLRNSCTLQNRSCCIIIYSIVKTRKMQINSIYMQVDEFVEIMKQYPDEQ